MPAVAVVPLAAALVAPAVIPLAIVAPAVIPLAMVAVLAELAVIALVAVAALWGTVVIALVAAAVIAIVATAGLVATATAGAVAPLVAAGLNVVGALPQAASVRLMLVVAAKETHPLRKPTLNPIELFLPLRCIIEYNVIHEPTNGRK
ncbi:MAG: hypothetical protein NVS4B8_15930 [Herpetosiphon sp.]